ncbi:MAG: hypothetical protein KC418_18415 [Anaerolineales bacterium]|nr:hypothetical protein [Anaerolineales bacterium]MCB8952666.1 hypothetical protein [Ardenticatenales bacterium]
MSGEIFNFSTRWSKRGLSLLKAIGFNKLNQHGFDFMETTPRFYQKAMCRAASFSLLTRGSREHLPL